jgi:hypothetical protein
MGNGGPTARWGRKGRLACQWPGMKCWRMASLAHVSHGLPIGRPCRDAWGETGQWYRKGSQLGEAEACRPGPCLGLFGRQSCQLLCPSLGSFSLFGTGTESGDAVLGMSYRGEALRWGSQVEPALPYRYCLLKECGVPLLGRTEKRCKWAPSTSLRLLWGGITSDWTSRFIKLQSKRH